MHRVLYTVRARFSDPATKAEFLSWLSDGHVDQVIAAGAHSALIVELDPAPVLSQSSPSPSMPGPTTPPAHPGGTVEVHYVFATREALDEYIHTHAAALRADGLRRFPPDRGVTFERQIGRII
jgi:hypothetical protein